MLLGKPVDQFLQPLFLAALFAVSAVWSDAPTVDTQLLTPL